MRVGGWALASEVEDDTRGKKHEAQKKTNKAIASGHGDSLLGPLRHGNMVGGMGGMGEGTTCISEHARIV